MKQKDKAEERAEQNLARLFNTWAGTDPTNVVRLPQSGSNRAYYRLSAADGRTAIGVWGENKRENAAFLSFSRSLKGAGINVPEIYAENTEQLVYLQQDLGSTSLYDIICAERKAQGNNRYSPKLKEIYKKVLSQLVDIQTKGRNCIDFSLCYPRDAFDRQSMMWDLQYFKYYFLKLAGIAFDEELLEKDFDTFIEYLCQANGKYFLYRDMQSRNIMVSEDGTPWFIDYQGGRRGARQYDVASLLYDAKADMPNNVRNELLGYYVSRLRENEVGAFIRYFYGFCLIRIMQAMGAYGYRGYFERKEHFLKSIPFALSNLQDIVQHHALDIDIPELKRVWQSIITNEKLQQIGNGGPLTVRVSSFSYKHGIPVDPSGNGGGFVFDCRALPNPGREERYRKSTGRDADVVEYCAQPDREREMTEFISAAQQMVGQSIATYTKRGFTNLMVSFGCTGGQHRSVFCAEALARWIKERFTNVVVDLKHHEEPWGLDKQK